MQDDSVIVKLEQTETEERVFILPIGFMYEGEEIRTLPIADNDESAEEVYTKKPSSQSKLYTWFGQVLSASIASIGREKVSSAFLSEDYDRSIIPECVQAIPLLDAGSLLIQAQRECWEDEISNQQIRCINCNERLTATIDLKRIEIPKSDGDIQQTIEVKLDKTYTAKSGKIEQLGQYEGLRYNHISFRLPTLGDAIRRQNIAKDEVMFWRQIAFDCMQDVYFQGEPVNGIPADKESLPEGYRKLKGGAIFKEMSPKTLRSVRKQIQTGAPSAKYFYEEDCSACGEPTPFFATAGNFFTT